jgi:hypothetical protein
MADQDHLTGQDPGSSGGDASLLDALGARREARAEKTQQDFPLPGNDDRLWATCKLLRPERAQSLMIASAAGQPALLGIAQEFVADATVRLFMADGADDAGKPVRPRPLPGIDPDGLALSYSDDRLETMFPRLCPPRPGGDGHTPGTRVRALFGADQLVVNHATQIAGWMIGGGGDPGALAAMSAGFVGE